MINVFWQVFPGFPEVLVVKGLYYVEYMVCWKQNENGRKKKLRVRDPWELGRHTFITYCTSYVALSSIFIILMFIY